VIRRRNVRSGRRETCLEPITHDRLDEDRDWLVKVTRDRLDGDGVQPDHVTIVVIQRGGVVSVRLDVAMDDGAVMARFRLVDVFRRDDRRADDCQCREQVRDGTRNAEHAPIMVAWLRKRQSTQAQREVVFLPNSLKAALNAVASLSAGPVPQ
jgi:hypothetical protein